MRLVGRSVVAGCLLCSATYAATIVSGFDTDDGEGGRFHIRGADFEFEGTHEEGVSPVGGPFDSPSVRLGGPSFPGHFYKGPGTYRGQHYPELDYAPMFTVRQTDFFYDWPDLTLDRPGIYRLPFVMNGYLCASLHPLQMPGVCDVDIPVLRGVGIVTFYVDPYLGGPPGSPPALVLSRMEYEFVPEPGTLGLVLLGLAGVRATRRRRGGRSCIRSAG